MVDNEAESVLDNPPWNSLSTNHAQFAISNGLAKRYPPDVSPLVAIAALDTASLHDLAEIIAPGEVVGVVGDDLPSDAAGWTLHTSVLAESDGQRAAPRRRRNHRNDPHLSADDVPDMLALIDLTHPGPFVAAHRRAGALHRHPQSRETDRDGG